MPTRAEYEAAKQYQIDNPELFAAADPISEVIAAVQIINAYESAQPDDGTCPCVWFSPTEQDPNTCTCTHTASAHIDGLCMAQPSSFSA